MMTLEEKTLAMEKLVENTEFMNAYHKVESKSALQQLFAQYGVTLEKEEIDAFVSALNGASEELNVNALENIAGGAGIKPEQVLGWAWNIVKTTGKWAWEKGRQLANWENSR